jgi:hypothetical protein
MAPRPALLPVARAPDLPNAVVRGRARPAWLRSFAFTSTAIGVLFRTPADRRGSVAVPFLPQLVGVDGRGPHELTRRYDARS